jgi:hypothetical protein
MSKKLLYFALLLLAILAYMDYSAFKESQFRGCEVVTNPDYKPVKIPKEMFVGYQSNEDVINYKINIIAMEKAAILNHYRAEK